MNNSKTSQWDILLREAYNLIDHVNRNHSIISSWTFGGGTAMMLQIGHRESHDVDLFLDDPQILPYLTAAVQEYDFKIGTPSYNGDGSGHLKIAFEGVGEIDFIVTGHMTAKYSTKKTILGRQIELETVPEIVAKKVRFRGSNIQPRDIFDIAAACHAGFMTDIKLALSKIPEFRAIAYAKLVKLNPEYVDKIISQLIVRPEYHEIAAKAVEITKLALADN